MGLVTHSTMQVTDLPGIWRCRYWFPSNVHPGEDVSEYHVRIEHTGDGFALHSLPNEEGSYMQIHFIVESNLATGTWLEDTAPNGEFKGMVYSGVFQLIIDEDMKRMIGSWVGIGRGDQTPKIYDGRWEIDYLAENEAALTV